MKDADSWTFEEFKRVLADPWYRQTLRAIFAIGTEQEEAV